MKAPLGLLLISVFAEVIERILQSGLKGPITVFLISMLPVSELRGAIPVALHTFKMSIAKSYLVSVIGNLIPPLLILLFLGPFSRFLSKWRPFEKFFNWLFSHTKSRSVVVEKYKTFGLAIFVAIPLPITGAWTGSIAAFLLNMSIKYAMTGILVGVLTAGVIVTLISHLSFTGILIGVTILLLIGGVGFVLQRKDRR
jgi:uncharacterized membrane protein